MGSEREWLTVRQFVDRNPAVSMPFVYELLLRGGLPGAFKLGGKWLIPTDVLDRAAEGACEPAGAA